MGSDPGSPVHSLVTSGDLLILVLSASDSLSVDKDNNTTTLSQSCCKVSIKLFHVKFLEQCLEHNKLEVLTVFTNTVSVKI